MVSSGFFKKPKSLIPWGSSKSIKMATRSPALGLNTVFNRRERLNGGKVSGTVSFVWAIIDWNFVLRPTLVKERICSIVTKAVTNDLQKPGNHKAGKSRSEEAGNLVSTAASQNP